MGNQYHIDKYKIMRHMLYYTAQMQYVKRYDTLIMKCVLLYFTPNTESHLTFCIFEVHKAYWYIRTCESFLVVVGVW
jgi:hypothetical protein